MHLARALSAGLWLTLIGCPSPESECGPTTCAGCCDAANQCQAGLVTEQCGSAGARCQDCGVGVSCLVGACTTTAGVGGGVAGGSAGGTSGGNVAGGSAGGTAGGNVAGGSAGGAIAGGSAGGNVSGGVAGGAGGGLGRRDAGTDPRCSGTLASCGASCVDLEADFNNCGACGRVCGPGLVCNFGTCAALPSDCVTGGGCAPGYFCNPTTRACQMGCRLNTDCPSGATCSNGSCLCASTEHICGQACVSNTAPTSCGARCERCAAPDGGSATCANQQCGVSCNVGHRSCGGQCPACATPQNATESCSGTACVFSCNAGFHRCGDQCLSNTSTASCGSACAPCAPPANATATCDGGACGFECLPSFRWCSGACVMCSTPQNGRPVCNTGSCDFACNTGFHRCGSQCPADTDPTACGPSCTVCPPPPANATATCVSDACDFRCDPGFLRCDSGCCAVTALTVGWDHACVLTSGGTVWCWGSNGRNQLTSAVGATRNRPFELTVLGNDIAAVAAGGYTTCALARDGGTSCWGENDWGQAGVSSGPSRASPVRITAHQSTVVDLMVGRSHTCTITSSGAVRCFGDNGAGQLGFGNVTSGATQVGVGGFHTCAIVSGTLRCWGENTFGQLGTGDTVSNPAPFTVPGLSATWLTTGGSYTCAVQTDAGLSCWGSNTQHQLGNRADGGVLAPAPVLTAPVSRVSGTFGHTCATSAAGAWCWGNNLYGQLGDGTQVSRETPVAVQSTATGIAEVETGFEFTCLRTTTGLVRCWGRNSQGQLGDGTNVAQRSTPTDIRP